MSRLNQEFRVEMGELERVRQWLLAVFQQRFQSDSEIQHDILVAVTEIFVNFIKHSKLKAEDIIQIQLDFTDEILIIIFKESGEPFDITQLEDPDLDGLHESGYGLFIVKNLMDSFEYFPKNSDKAQNITKITKGYRHGER
jgi:anti-sigma regulatory factor (Ser/Thr protein kinase)